MVGRVLQQDSERCDRQMFPAWPFSVTHTVPCRHAATANTCIYSWPGPRLLHSHDCLLLFLESETLTGQICLSGHLACTL